MRKLILAIAILAPAVSLANGYDVPNTNPRDMAMVSSGLAAQNDSGAAYVNPSALSKLQGLDVNASFSFLDLTTKWSGPSATASNTQPDLVGESAKTKFRPVTPVAISVGYGFKLADRNAGVGFAMNVPGGGNVFYKDDWAGRGRIITVDRKIYGFYLTGGYEVIPQLRLGAGLVYYYGTEYLKQGIQPFSDAYGELSTKGGGLSYDLSAEYTLPTLPLTLAIDWKYKATMKLSGNGHFVVPEGLLPNNEAPPVDQGVKHNLTYPSVLNVGVAYRITKPWLVSAVWTWNGYSVYGSDTFIGDKGTTINVERNYRNGYTFRLGTEYDLNPRVRLRGGVERDISGLRTDTYSPTLPDSNSWAAGLGAGWEFRKNLSLNASFFYAWLDKVTVTGTKELPGSYSSNVWIASAGVAWRTDLGGGK